MPPFSEMLEAFGYGVLLPLALTLAGLWLARRCQRWRVWAGASIAMLTLAVAFLTAWFSLPLGPYQPPSRKNWEWLPYAFLAAGGIVALTGLAPAHLPRIAGVAVAAFVAADRILPARLDAARIDWLVGVTGAGLVLFLWLEDTGRRHSARYLAATLSATCMAAAVVLMLADHLLFSQAGGILMACAAGGLLLAWREKLPAYLLAALPLLAIPLCGVLASAWLNSFADVSPWAFLLLWLAPCPHWLGQVSSANEKARAGWQTKLPFGILLAILGCAVLLAASNSTLLARP